MSARHDALVVGGGPAGAAFAARLAAAGRVVVIVERETGPCDKVCGEFLSAEALASLERLDVDLRALGARPIGTVRVSRGARCFARDLPFRAMSLSRRRLDEALLKRAAALGAEVSRGARAIELKRDVDLWTVRLGDGRTLSAHAAALATGKHDLRGHVRPAAAQNDLIGLKSHFRLTERARAMLEGTVELGFFPGGYAGLEPIEDGVANLCLVVRGSVFAQHGRDWRTLLAAVTAAAPRFGLLLDGAAALQDDPLAVARIPYGLVLSSADDLWRLGDQAAVIPSFAGEGLSIALRSAGLAADAFLMGRPAQTFQTRLAADVRMQVRLATAVSRAVVHGPMQTLAAAALRFAPWSLSSVAAATRIGWGRAQG